MRMSFNFGSRARCLVAQADLKSKSRRLAVVCQSFRNWLNGASMKLQIKTFGVCQAPRLYKTTQSALLLGAVAILIAAMPQSVKAQSTFNWVPNAAFTWNQNTSWTPVSPATGFPNAAGDIARLEGSSLIPVVTLGEDITIGSLSYRPSAERALTISAGNKLIFDTGTAANATFIHRQSGGARAQALIFNNAIELKSTLDADIRTTRNATFGGTISGDGALNITINSDNSQENARRLVFSAGAANTHAGGTSINGANSAATGSSHIILSKENAMGTGLLTLTGNYVFNLSGNNQSVAGLQGSASGTPNNGWYPLGIINTAANTRTLTLNLVDGEEHTYSGIIRGQTLRVDNTNLSGNMALTVNKASGAAGTGVQILSGDNTYTGATLVNAGTLLVNGSLANTAVTVADGAIFGGTGTLGGTLNFADDSFFQVVDLNNALGVTGNVTFGSGFGIENLLGIDWDTVALNTAHTIINTTQTFSTSDISNFEFDNRVAVGSGREAYFTSGSLNVMVITATAIPEPSSAILVGSLGLLLLRRRRS